MTLQILTESNYNVFAMNGYDNPFCLTEEEFFTDLNKIKLIKRYVTRYKLGKCINLRVLTNLVIEFFNVFEHTTAKKLLFFKMENDTAEIVNALMKYLCLSVESSVGINEVTYKQLIDEFGQFNRTNDGF